MSPPDDASDDELMTAYARGDAASFERLYRRHQAALYRFVRRLLGAPLSAQTDEVFQDTWLRVVNARERWEPQGATFRTWLFTLAHHRVIDLLRRSGREISVDAFESDGDEPWQPDAAAWQHWPAPAGAAPQGDELAFWRRVGIGRMAQRFAQPGVALGVVHRNPPPPIGSRYAPMHVRSLLIA